MLVELASFHPRLKGHGVLTFEDLMMLPFGVVGHRFVLGAMLITAYGAMVAYLLIVKDTLVRSAKVRRRAVAVCLTCCHSCSRWYLGLKIKLVKDRLSNVKLSC